MFLSYPIVPVFVFTILLNFIYVYSADETPATTPPTTPPTDGVANNRFSKCDDCVKSRCHGEFKGPCVATYDTNPFLCIQCLKTSSPNPQFYKKEECESECKDNSKTCICEDYCYVCAPKEYTSKSPNACNTFQNMMDDACQKHVPIVLPDGTVGAPPQETPHQ